MCKKVMFVKEAHVKKGWGKYCSKSCQFKGQKIGKWVACFYCGKKVYRRPSDFRKTLSNRFFCSVNCHCSWENKNIRCGENAPNWIAGHNVYRKIMKKHKKSEDCSHCGHSDERVLDVHHLDHNRKNNSIDNLIWLCKNCHYIVHLSH